EYFQFVELLFGGLPGRGRGDGLDGHSWWPLFRTTPSEYAESYYPVRVEAYTPVQDSGGPGLKRGGTGIEKTYAFTGSGTVSIADDRAIIAPWGINGGLHGGRSSKTLVRVDGTREALPSKVDGVQVSAGDVLIFRTAGAGGWGDPLERPAELVALDLERGLISVDSAREAYGVIVDEGKVDTAATSKLRGELASERGPAPDFDFGERPGVPTTQEVAA
ncbi:MAG: hydantoinase B/oxoprolinase family protein, partial [Solirubrobacteraceae bacterium]|nr:hydantoinase B/oxoprolinase family protein [Solirubrobacteraceae bacterium]